MSRLRSLDSKISFFAFADIITAVSGVLIFIALLLATDLGRPTNSKVSSTNPDIEQQIQEALAQQVEVDAQNQRLQELLSTANTSPDADKLQADIKRLKTQLAEEQNKQGVLLQQMSESQDAIAKRDAELGLTTLKSQIDKEKESTKYVETKEADEKAEIATLEQHIAGLQSELLQLRQREGKLWLIPEKGMTTKEPILAIVSSHGINLERFDHPEMVKQLQNATVRSDFEDYVKTFKSADEYVVFLIRPSGIALFQDLVKTARDQNIDVGYDAIEEDKDVYFAPPPVLDVTIPMNMPSGYTSGSGGYSDPKGGGGIPGGTGGTKAGARNGSDSGGFSSGVPGGTPGGSTAGGRTGATGGSANGTGTGAAGGSQGGNSFFSGTGWGGGGTGSSGNGTGKESGNGKGQGEGNANLGQPGNGSGSSGNASVKTNAPTGEVKREAPKTNSVSTPTPPTPVTKSWWQRFMEWVGSFFK